MKSPMDPIKVTRRTTYRLLVAAAFIVLTSVNARSDQGVTITEMVVFGDSYADTGNLFIITAGGLPPSPPYFNGRFSNGPLWVDVLALGLGLDEPGPSILGGTNFAFGGAVAGPGPGPFPLPPVEAQIGTYLTHQEPTGSELFVISAGGNNFNPANPGGPDSPEEVADWLQDHVLTLALAGGKYFVVRNTVPAQYLPSLAGAPETVVAEAADRQRRLRSLLASRLAQLRNQFGIKIVYLDTYQIMKSMIRSPHRFGIANVTDAALFTSPADADTFFWWDTQHPTAKVHLELGVQALDQVTTQLKVR